MTEVTLLLSLYVLKCQTPFRSKTYGDVGGEAGDERRGDGVRDGRVGTLGLLSRRGDDVESNEGVETSGGALHHLRRSSEESNGNTLSFARVALIHPFMPSSLFGFSPQTIQRAGSDPRPSSPR